MTTHKGMIQIHDAKYKLGSGLLFLCDNLCKIHQLVLESLLPLSEDGFAVSEHFRSMYTTHFSYQGQE